MRGQAGNRLIKNSTCDQMQKFIQECSAVGLYTDKIRSNRGSKADLWAAVVDLMEKSAWRRRGHLVTDSIISHTEQTENEEMSTTPAPKDLDVAWNDLLLSRDALREVTDTANTGLRECLRSVKAYRLHKKRTNSETVVDYGVVAELINQLELLCRNQ